MTIIAIPGFVNQLVLPTAQSTTPPETEATTGNTVEPKATPQQTKNRWKEGVLFAIIGVLAAVTCTLLVLFFRRSVEDRSNTDFDIRVFCPFKYQYLNVTQSKNTNIKTMLILVVVEYMLYTYLNMFEITMYYTKHNSKAIMK